MMKTRVLNTGLALLLLVGAGLAQANPITRVYGTNSVDNGSGTVTYESTANTLTITFDNTSAQYVEGTMDPNSSLITGVVFDIDAVINAATITSFTDGDGMEISGDWEVLFNVNNEITPGNTTVDVSFTTTNGVNGGIYNSDWSCMVINCNNAFPDIAVLVLNITDPGTYSGLTSISNDILRMQRVGLNGAGSLKLPGGPDGETPPSAIPEPSILALLGLGLAGIGVFRRRQS